MASQSLGPLELASAERAATWLIAFNALARSRKWKDEQGKQLSITDNFLSTCGLPALEKLQYLVKPRTLCEMAFCDIEAAINDYTRPKKHLIIAERTSFYNISQKTNESVADYIARLRQAAEYCDFDSLKLSKDPTEEMIRVALIAGLQDKSAKRLVLDRLHTVDLSVPEIRDLVQQNAQTTSFVDQASNISAPSPTSDINFSTTGGRFASPNGHSSSIVHNCNSCGRSHRRRQCPAFGRTCSKCNKRNHFASVCRSSGFSHCQPKPVHATFETRESSEEDNFCVTIATPTCINNVDNLEPVLLNDHNVNMQRDTGASISVLSSNLWNAIGKPPLTKSHHTLHAYDGHTMMSLGKFSATICINNRFHPIDLVVVESDKNFGLLGRDFLREESIHMTVPSTPELILPTIKGVKAKMELRDDATPMFCRARPVPIAMESKVNAELRRLQDMGVITPITEGGVDNASPVVWVRKANGELRMCVDFKVHINSKIKTDAYPSPNIETIFSKLKNANKFAKIDLSSAYWQIELDEKSRELSVINTSKGLFYVNRLQMGMKNASAIFQRVMEQILHDLKGILIYQDDILIYGENELSLRKRVNAVKTRLREKDVTINESKSVEYMDEISFLGFSISARGIMPDEKLVNKILTLEAPQNKQEVEHFIGLVNYFGRLIPNFTCKVAPINKLRNANTPFRWTPECNTAFELLRKEIASSPVVQPYDADKEATLWTDASQNSIAAVLTQDQHPVIYISRTLSKAEANYSNIERESLAIVWAVTRLKHFVAARHFTIATDHRPLEQLFHPEKPVPVSKTSPRICRWALLLMQYDFAIRYIAGKEIPHVDALSRLRFNSSPNPEDEKCNEVLSVHSVQFQNSVISNPEIRSEPTRDPFIQRIGWRVVSGNWNNCSQAELPFKHAREKLTIESGTLYYGSRVFIPLRLRQRAFHIAHDDSHAGIHSSIKRLKTSSWWPNMSRDIERFVNDCSLCQTSRPRTSHSVDQWPPSFPFQRIHMDWAMIPDIGNILVIVDSGSGWIEAFRCRDRSSEIIIKCLRTVFARFGIPELVVSDNAPEFTSNELIRWLNAIGANKMESPPYFPQANGSAERAVQTVKRALSCWKDTKQDFDVFLQRVLFNHRIASNSRGRSPAEIVFGKPLRAPVVSTFSQGETLLYKPTAKTVPIAVEFLMTKGKNTSWVIDSRAEHPKLTLASNNQLAPHSSLTHDNQTSDNNTQSEVSDPTQQLRPSDLPAEPGLGQDDWNPPSPTLRRSQRTKNLPNRYGVAISH